jgi:hypothetical protein
MLSWARARLTYANVIATIALFLALGGTGYAALKLPKNSVGPQQLKKNAVTSAKVKAGSLLTSDFKSSQRRGLRGPAGPKGDSGAQGPPGPVNGNLPSGATLRGVFNVDFEPDAAGEIDGDWISFGMRLPSKPAVVVQQIDAPPTTNCPGTMLAPEAAPGFLCIYKFAEYSSELFVCDLDCNPDIAEPYGALIYVHSTTVNRAYVEGSWAVTAP